MVGHHYTTDLQQALESRLPYDSLSFTLRQRLTLREYQQQCVIFAAKRYHSYQRLPEFVLTDITEESYYKSMITCLREKLQLYPYPHIRKVVHYTRETPLTYYTTMVAELLKAEYSYDTLPNFTAVDILNSLGIGRNEYLELTKDVRSKLMWYINRQFVKNHIPTEFLPSLTLPPFWDVFAVNVSVDVIKKAALTNAEISLYRQLLRRQSGENKGGSNITTTTTTISSTDNNTCDCTNSNTTDVGASCGTSTSCYACELPNKEINQLFRKGFVCATFTVSPDSYVILPPLERFVMNRTSDDPAEVLLYRVLATIDNRTPLSLLAQLLMLDEADVCTAVHIYIRLGLAQLRTIHIPENFTRSMDSVHQSWRDVVQGFLADAAAASASTSASSGLVMQSLNGGIVMEKEGNSNNDGSGCGSHPSRRVALLYDASLTGFLMMTNLSTDPTFKQNAVTLFEVGKLSDEKVVLFIEKLEQVDCHTGQEIGGEAMRYIQSVISLREVLKVLRSILGPDNECGVDMLKVESLNDLEATTRYSVLGRNYWAYFVISPLSYAPLIDMALNCIYGSTVSLMPSPWMTLFLYTKMAKGPPSLLLPVGARLVSWPPLFLDSESTVAKLRLQPLTMDAEATYVDASTSIILLNEMTAMAPIFIQRVEDVSLELAKGSDGSGAYLIESPTHMSLDVMLPFTASDAEAMELLQNAVMQHCRVTSVCLVDEDNNYGSKAVVSFLDLFHAAVATASLQDSLGCLTLHVSFVEVNTKEAENLKPATEEDAPADSANFAHAEAAKAEKTVGAACRYKINEVFITNIDLGIPLSSQECCSIIVRHLEDVLSEARSERHNSAMRRMADDFGVFLESYSPLTASAREKMALLSALVLGPTTQMHIRRLGGCSNGGVPFPGTMIFFDGERLSLLDDLDPLVDLWEV